MTKRARRPAVLASLVLVAGALTLVAFWPVRTHIGVDYQVAEHRLPLWRKGWAFLERDRKTQRLADSLSASFSAADSEALALAFLDWTRKHVRPHPAEVPVVDDHVWSIIERGYGSNDQQTDVFTTLLTYAGVPAYWRLSGPDGALYPLALVLIDGSWRVFDVEHGVTVRDSRGMLATAEQMAADPELVRSSAVGLVPDPDSYATRFERFVAAPAPPRLRAEMQMPRKRLRYELERLLGRDR